MVTENICRAFDAQQKMEHILDELEEIYGDLPEDDDDEEKFE